MQVTGEASLSANKSLTETRNTAIIGDAGIWDTPGMW